jgi:hypothetical protein
VDFVGIPCFFRNSYSHILPLLAYGFNMHLNSQTLFSMWKWCCFCSFFFLKLVIVIIFPVFLNFFFRVIVYFFET